MTPQPAVIFGGPSPEHDVSILTGLQAARALAGAGHQVQAIYWSKVGEWFLVDADLEAEAFLEGVPKKATPLRLVAATGGGFVTSGGKGGLLGGGKGDKALEITAAVNCCHGGPGEDGTLQGVLDLAGVAYTGPDVAAAALGMDKLAFGAVVRDAGLPSLPRVAVLDSTTDVGFEGPYIVKPRFGGSSIGIETVPDLATAKALLKSSVHLRAGAVVEPFRPDSEDVNIAVRSWPELELSAIEKPVRGSGGEILGYADKYVGGEGMVSAPRELPAHLPDGVADQVRSMATRVAALAGVRGLARIDFLLDGGELFVNENNTNPGSLSKYLWIDPPVAFDALLEALLDEAIRRPSIHYTAQGADGSALRSAGTIASKLG
jgi:D-alanine-D-alanine ligase